MLIRTESCAKFNLLQTFFVFLITFVACSPTKPTTPNEVLPTAPSTLDEVLPTAPSTPDEVLLSPDTLYLPLILSSEEDPTLLVEDTATSEPSATVANILEDSPTLAPTIPETSCPHPAGWFIYIIKAGDTLSAIGRATGATVQELKNANCRVSDDIYPGDPLYVPHLPVSATPTFKPPDTPTPTNTPLPPPPKPTKTPTPTHTEAAPTAMQKLLTETMSNTPTP